MSKEHKPSPWWWLFVSVMAAPTIYFGLYLLMLERKVYRPIGIDPATKRNIFAIEPNYRVSSNWVLICLEHAYQLDRHFRNDYWMTIEHSDGRKWKNP